MPTVNPVKIALLGVAIFAANSCLARTPIDSGAAPDTAEGDCRIVALSRAHPPSRAVEIRSVCFDGSKHAFQGNLQSADPGNFMGYVQGHKIFYEKKLTNENVIKCIDLLESVYEMDTALLRRVNGKPLPDYTKNFLVDQFSIHLFYEHSEARAAFVLRGAAIEVYFNPQNTLVAEYLEY